MDGSSRLAGGIVGADADLSYFLVKCAVVQAPGRVPDPPSFGLASGIAGMRPMIRTNRAAIGENSRKAKEST
jgi:hypothetical protein